MSAQAAKSEVMQLDEVRAQRIGDTLGPFRPGHKSASNEAQSIDPSLSVIAVNVDAALKRESNSTGQNQRLGSNFWVSAAGSCALHVALFAWLLWHEPMSTPGAGGHESEAIGIEIVTASVLESRASQAVLVSGGAVAATDQASGLRAAVDQVEVSAQTKSSEPKSEPPAAILKSDQLPVPAEVAAADTIQLDPKPRKEEPKPGLDKLKQDHTPVTVEQQAQSAIIAGGASSRATTESPATDGSAGASAGQFSRYAIDVRLAIGSARPRHDGRRGKVQISFGLTDTGAVRFAEIALSSGSTLLDDAARQAILSTPFPTPPAGMTDAQRTYVVAFDFK